MLKAYSCAAVAAFLFIGLLGCKEKSIYAREMPASDDEVQLRMELVREIKNFESVLGWAPTNNFEYYDESLGSYDYCAESPLLDFALSWSKITKEECARIGESEDVVFYRLEALAAIGTPLSRSLAKADLARFISVVFHEDFHEQARGISARSLNESAAMFVGLLAAREFAREKYGENSELYRVFSNDIEAALADARIEERYYEKLTRLYEDVKKGLIVRDEGLKKKKELYKEMRDECKSIVLATAQSCREIANNAIFENGFHYAKQYPLFYGLHARCGGDVRKTSSLIIKLASEELTEEEFLRRVNTMIDRGCE